MAPVALSEDVKTQRCDLHEHLLRELRGRVGHHEAGDLHRQGSRALLLRWISRLWRGRRVDGEGCRGERGALCLVAVLQEGRVRLARVVALDFADPLGDKPPAGSHRGPVAVVGGLSCLHLYLAQISLTRGR